ncbi:MAG TPA: UDP-3-O-(3-hydroxymyristoyl)glucosamine N-acyltransferase [Candidatus Baltobacteraceae bacterium]|nr:UDP-3-O-(3-hydroxymyristoyl)glucosamine N-acyltransferase [Candidatus Baltobacteraceae bacterium]
MRLGDLAEQIGCRLEGDGSQEIRRVRPLEFAGPDDLSFVTDAAALGRAAASRAGALILPEKAPAADRPCLRTPNPYLAFARALALLEPVPRPTPGIDSSAVVHPSARVDPSSSIGPLCVIGAQAEVGPDTVLDAQVYVGADCRVGRGCRVYPQVTVREGTCIGNGVIIHSGAVIGADGFGYAKDGARYVKIPQVGRVVIEDEVEIGANTTIDRATMGETRIGRGSKIDNLVQLAHNVRVGPDSVILAQVGVAGSTQIGARVTLAGQVGIVDHVLLGDDVIVGSQAGVTKDIPAGSVVLGSPAVPHREFKRQLAAAARLPEYAKALRAIEARLADLERRAAHPDADADAAVGTS